MIEKRGWWKDAGATALLMCFAFACDTEIAAHSQRVFFIAIAVSRVLEGARIPKKDRIQIALLHVRLGFTVY